MNILISSAGRRVELIECFRESARALDLDLRVYATDAEPELSAACQIADDAISVPRCDDPSFIDAMLEVVKAHDIALVVPTIDTELPDYAANAGKFKSIGSRVHVSSPEVIAIARDKQRTTEVFEKHGLPVPWTMSLEAARACSYPIIWPMFLKPSRGSASRGIMVASSSDDLPKYTDEPMILQQLLVGPEYTVNMFIDAHGSVRNAIAHRRLRIRAGEVEKGRTERDPMFRELAEGVARALPGARGTLCFQVIIDQTDGPRIFEVNARYGGGYPLAHHAGAEHTRWLLEEVAGLPSSAHDDWRSGVLMLRYDATVFRE